MQAHFEKLLQNIVESPEVSLDALSILPDAERSILLDDWNATQRKETEVLSIHALIEQQAKEHPNAKAVVFEDESLTYQELNEQANSVAQHLIKKGLEKNDLVGLCTERSLEMIVGMLGILKAGGAYVPLDPEYPQERIDFMIEDANMPILLTQIHLMSDISAENTQVVALETIRPATENIDLPTVQPSDTAYVIYTSGSTGKPKGVIVTHGNLIHSTTARFDFYEDSPSSFLLLSSFSFDSSIVGLFWTLCSGGQLVLPKYRIEQDLEALGSLMENHKISHTLLVPSLYTVILEHLPTEQLSNLNTVVVAGEACSASLCQQHFDKFGTQVRLYNEYGPTEASVWCIAHEIKADDTKGAIPIGRPISNTTVYILDENLNPVPIGISGELYIGGKGISKGYLNRPELTSERFVPNPFVENANEKMYRTGDVAKYRNDGIIDFLGRADQQVKIRGYRIELEEIRETIKQHKGVNEAIVMVQHKKAKAEVEEEIDEFDSLINQLSALNAAEAERILAAVEAIEDEDKIDVILEQTSMA